MDINTFNNKYKEVARQVSKVLSNNNCNSLKDIKIIFDMFLGFPCLIDGQHYMYYDKLYDSIESLPISAKKAMLKRLNYGYADVITLNEES